MSAVTHCYSGSYADLRKIILATSIRGAWEHMPPDYWRFTAINGAILNYWPTAEAVGFEGPRRAVKRLHLEMRKTFNARRKRHEVGKTR